MLAAAQPTEPAIDLTTSTDAPELLRRRREVLEVSTDRWAEQLVNHLATVTGMRQWTLNRRADEAFVVLAASPATGGLRKGNRLPWTSTLCARMASGVGPRVAGRLDDTVYGDAASDVVQSYLGVPILDATGRVVGSLSGTDSRSRLDLAEHLPLVELLASLASQILGEQALLDDQARALDQAVSDSETDSLTGLPNRRAWERVLNAEQSRLDAHGTQSAVLVFDVDHLKITNDTYGHGAGDVLIRRVSVAIRAAARACDFVARIGGDEFAILLGDITNEELGEVADRLRHTVAEVRASVSLGGAVTEDQGLRHTWEAADRAMYDEKARRKSLG